MFNASKNPYTSAKPKWKVMLFELKTRLTEKELRNVCALVTEDRQMTVFNSGIMIVFKQRKTIYTK